MSAKELGMDTRAIHAGEPSPRVNGAVVAPLYPTSTYEYGGEATYDDVRYTRLSNTPNHALLNEKLARLEGAEKALVTGSGMAAITSALLTAVGPGEHLVAQGCLYGGTHHFLLDQFPRMGRSVSFFPMDGAGELEKLIRPETRAVYVEGIANPLLQTPDLREVVAVARRRGLTTLIDNTFLSPVNFNPIPFGFDVVLHSATKYLNGHTDVVAGVVAGRAETVDRVRSLLNHLGGSLDAFSCFLLNRGLKTLGVRVRAQSEGAMKLATVLQSHPKVSRVIYPGLPSHPHHGRAKEWFRSFGAMLCFEYAGPVKALDEALSRLELFAVAPSLGGVESLVTRPVTTSHAGVPAEERERLGIRDTLVRVSVGLEDPADLIADFQMALG